MRRIRGVVPTHACVSIWFGMAEGSVDPLSQSFKKLNEELSCPVCHHHFKEPKVLPCLHYYCKKCIGNLMACNVRVEKECFNCPECRRDVQLPANAPERYRTVYQSVSYNYCEHSESPSKFNGRTQGGRWIKTGHPMAFQHFLSARWKRKLMLIPVMLQDIPL